MTAIDILMEEHQLILQVLDSFELQVENAANGDTIDHKLFGKYAVFFKEFADKCHHGKEEDILFEDMMKNGFHRDVGPLAVMYSEHSRGREQVRIIERAGKAEELSEEMRVELLEACGVFIQLLRDHIYKEDNVLFPMAQNNLPVDTFDDMLDRFKNFDHYLDQGSKKRLVTLGKKLAALGASVLA